MKATFFSFVKTTIVYQFKAKDSEIKDSSLCLGKTSKDFAMNNMIKTGLKPVVSFFSNYFNPIDTNDILDIHKYLMKITQNKIMFELILKKYLFYL